MKFPWPWRRRPKLPAIPPYDPQPPAPVAPKPPPEPAIIVEEHDTSDMTRTGVHRAWDRLTGKFKE